MDDSAQMFIIASVPRSGSTFARRLLCSHPDILCHGELFYGSKILGAERPLDTENLPDIRARDADPGAFMDWILGHHKSGRVGFKLMLTADAMLLEHVQRRGMPVIHVRRENALARYSSSLIAAETGQRVVRFSETRGRLQQPGGDHASQTVRVRFDADQFQEHRLWCEGMEKRLDGASNILVTEYNEIGGNEWSNRVCHFLGVERHCLSASTSKLNSSDIMARFSNPEEVEKYLVSIGRLDWAKEGS